MNFKPVVASLFVLGLVSAPAMAAPQAKEHHKHQKHHARHQEHHGVRAEQSLSSEGFAQERFVNASSAKSPVASFDWANRIHFSGMINVDGKYSSRSPLGTVPGFNVHEYTTEFNVNNANLFVDVDINHCVTGHLGLAYVADSVNLFDVGVNTRDDFEAYTNAVRSDKGAVWANGTLGVDEAYVTVRDFAQSPFYLRVGKMYLPFGDNQNLYPITESFSQLLTQTRATSVQLGWVSSYGLHASVYALDGASSSLNTVAQSEENDDAIFGYTSVQNWGAQLGYCSAYNDIRYHVSGSYIKDIRDVEYLAALQDLTRFNGLPFNADFETLRRSGGAFHGDMTYGPYALSANYVTALRDTIASTNNDAHINAGDVTGSYNTNVWGYDTGFSLGYQRSGEASHALLPRYRYQGDISVNVLPHTTVGLEYHYDRDYGHVGFAPADAVSIRGGRSGNSSSTAALRLGVAF
jgi:hypothetical protein